MLCKAMSPKGTRMNRKIAPLIVIAACLAGLPAAPALAQSEAGDRVNQVIIFGNDECPRSSENVITVCARLDESERFRIPPRLRESSSPENEAWSQRARSLETVGSFGPLTCTPVGAGGDLGCTPALIQRAYEERAQASDVRFGELIAEARSERMAEIDGEAAETQRRVELLERSYLDRLEREQGAEDAAPAEALPEIVDPQDMPSAQ
jgi:hypothetical protein